MIRFTKITAEDGTETFSVINMDGTTGRTYRIIYIGYPAMENGLNDNLKLFYLGVAEELRLRPIIELSLSQGIDQRGILHGYVKFGGNLAEEQINRPISIGKYKGHPVSCQLYK